MTKAPSPLEQAVRRSRQKRWIDLLRGQLKVHEIQAPELEEEYVFLEDRRFRFDFALPARKIGIEVEGGVFTARRDDYIAIGGRLRRVTKASRHTTGVGFQEDCYKYNRAAIDGWLVLRFTSNQITSGLAVRMIRDAMKARSSA